jgi:hypothetical protein
MAPTNIQACFLIWNWSNRGNGRGDRLQIARKCRLSMAQQAASLRASVFKCTLLFQLLTNVFKPPFLTPVLAIRFPNIFNLRSPRVNKAWKVSDDRAWITELEETGTHQREFRKHMPLPPGAKPKTAFHFRRGAPPPSNMSDQLYLETIYSRRPPSGGVNLFHFEARDAMVHEAEQYNVTLDSDIVRQVHYPSQPCPSISAPPSQVLYCH